MPNHHQSRDEVQCRTLGALQTDNAWLLQVSQIIGPALIERPVPEGTDHIACSEAACMATCLETGRGFAVLLDSRKDITSKYIVLQAVVRWTLKNGQRIERVCAHNIL